MEADFAFSRVARYFTAMKWISRGALAALALGLFGLTVRADPTAFDLIKAGDQYVGSQSKDRVVQIRSDKSFDGLTPNVWYIVYYDPTAALKATEVKFGAGRMINVSRPWRLLEPVTGGDRVLDSDKLKVDSDRALKIAMREPLLKDVDLRATQFWLEHGDLGPRWRIRFFAARLSDRTRTADIGEVFIAADTGEVLHDTLHPSSAN